MMVGRELSAVFPKRDGRRGRRSRSKRAGSRSRPPASTTCRSRSARARSSGSPAWSARAARELAETLFGLTPADSGEIRIARAGDARSRSPPDAIAPALAYVPEDRRQHGVVLEMSVAANIEPRES